jgi:TATA-binding protein-associated factor
MKSYLEMIIEHILVPNGIKFTQLLSAHSGKQRFEIVEQYNNDTSISVMIMTAAVGGLGLNLTGADTVIFMEHDWNPMKDLQAIDRAHRIGQKRVVNVYRLILMDSLEQKIMSLQRFKKNLAKNLIQSQRADMSIQDAENMQMHDLLSCFEEHTVYDKTTKNKTKIDSKNVGAESYEDKVIEDVCGTEIWS